MKTTKVLVGLVLALSLAAGLLGSPGAGRAQPGGPIADKADSAGTFAPTPGYSMSVPVVEPGEADIEVIEFDSVTQATVPVSRWVYIPFVEVKHNAGPLFTAADVAWVASYDPAQINFRWMAEAGDTCTLDGMPVSCDPYDPTEHDINDLHFTVDLPVSEKVFLWRTADIHCKQEGTFLIDVQNIETPVDPVTDPDPTNNEASTQIEVFCIADDPALPYLDIMIGGWSAPPEVYQTVSEWESILVEESKYVYSYDNLTPPLQAQVLWRADAPPEVNVRWVAQPGDTCTLDGVVVDCDPTVPTEHDINDLEFVLELDPLAETYVDRELEIHCKEPGQYQLFLVNQELPFPVGEVWERFLGPGGENLAKIEVVVNCEAAEPEAQDPTFSISRNGPSVPAPVDPSDLIVRSPGGTYPPTVVYPCPAFGSPFCLSVGAPWPGDDGNALSLGQDFTLPPPDPANPDAHLFFSVAPGSPGLPGTGVDAEVAGCVPAPPEPEADEFGSAATGGNYQFMDGDGVANCTNPSAPALGLVDGAAAGPGDDLDALDPLNQGGTVFPVFVSLDQQSVVLPLLGLSAAEIFRDLGAGIPAGGVYALAAQLGLDPSGDDIDALCIDDADGDSFYSPGDTVWFSLTANSMTLPLIGAGPSDVLAPNPAGGPPVIVVPAGNLGLDPWDDELNALKCYEQPEEPQEPHYYCYWAPGYDPDIAVHLETQFGPEDVDVGQGDLLCAPAEKTRAGQPPEGTMDGTHLRMFDLWNANPGAPPPGRVVNLETQFGYYENVEVGRPFELAMPVSKEVVDPPTGEVTPLEAEPHYKCYSIWDADLPPVNETVQVETQFGVEEVLVQQPYLLCLPAEKNFEPVTQDAPHQVCYVADAPSVNWVVNLYTQFAAPPFDFWEEFIDVYSGDFLCVPAIKEVVEQRPTFSIEDFGPSTPNGGGPFDPADILYNPGAPMQCIPCASLGLMGCSPMPPDGFDDMDALSYGADFGPYSSQEGYLGFSVDEGSQGQPGTAVNVEATCAPPEPEADEFITPLDGSNTQYFDGDGFPCGTNAGAPLGIVEPWGDVLDALGEKDCPEVDWTDPMGGPPDGFADREVYFSLTPGSPSLPMIPATEGDILVTLPVGGIVVYAPEHMLGLGTFGPGDDVNGLCLAETSWPPGHPDREWFDPDGIASSKDYLFFTLESSSPTVGMGMADASDILYVPMSGMFVIVDEETALGLIPPDDVDAIKCIKGLVDISIDDFVITLPDGTDVRSGDISASAKLTVSEWTDFGMFEVKHYYGVEGELSPPIVTSQVGWAVLPPVLPIPLNVRFNALPGDICTDIVGAPVPCGEGGVAGVPWDPDSLPDPPPPGIDSCKDGIDNDGDTRIDDPVSNPVNPDPDCVDIFDVHFALDLPWSEDVGVGREVQIHCKAPGEFTITFENIELPLGADDIEPGNNTGYIDVTIICEEEVLIADKMVENVWLDDGSEYPFPSPLPPPASVPVYEQHVISITSEDLNLGPAVPEDALVAFYADIPPGCWGRWYDDGGFFPFDTYTVGGDAYADPFTPEQLGTVDLAWETKKTDDPAAPSRFEIDLHFQMADYYGTFAEEVGPDMAIPITRFFDFHCDEPSTHTFFFCNKIEPKPPYMDPDFPSMGGMWPGNNVDCVQYDVDVIAEVAAQDPSLSLHRNSPTLFLIPPAPPFIVPANEGDILDANAPGPPVDSIGCGPMGVGLGLPFCMGPGTDELNSLSYGVDFTLPPPDGVHWLFFSVAPGSDGAAGSAVAGEASCLGQLPNNNRAEPEADVFGTKTLGSNIQNLDGDGAACNGNSASSVGLLEQPPAAASDDLDALDEMPVSFVDHDGDGMPDAPIYFTLDNASPSVPVLMPGPGGPPSPDDVFVCDPNWGCPVMFPPMVYADGVMQLGLQPGDEIDALCLWEDGDGEYFPPMGDVIVFSLSPASPSVLAGMFSAADVLTPGGPAGPIVIAGAQQIGLMTTDDLNALKCFEEQLFPDDDHNGLPDQWESQQTCGPLGPGDWDGDMLTDVQEYGLSTDPCKVDTDGDGCADGPTEETGANPATGGTRNPLDFYDFYDVLVPTVFWGPGGVRDQAVSILNDVLAVLEYTGTSNNGPPNGAGRDYDQDNDMNAVKDGVEYDRSVSLTGPWSGPPDGAITILTDVLLVLAQSGAICTAPPN